MQNKAVTNSHIATVRHQIVLCSQMLFSFFPLIKSFPEAIIF